MENNVTPKVINDLNVIVKELTNKRKNNEALRFVVLLLFIGILAIFIYASKAIFWKPENDPMISAVSIFSLATLLAGSALTGGCLVGFIFAIPKSVSNSEINLIKTGKGYISNDNLVQVSDWLTKIIVGVGLTKLTSIPYYIQSMGSYVGKSIGGDVWGEVAAESIVVYFSICGFLLAYLWTRLYFARMLEDSESFENSVENKPLNI
jgi:hypothetical protein